MKIDVENGEFETLRGALQTIRSERPHIVLEVGDIGARTTGTRDSLDLLIDEGYRAFELNDWDLRPHELRAVYSHQNLLLSPFD